MIVYGDHARLLEAGALHDRIGRSIRQAEAAAGIEGHGSLVAALIDAGMMLQAVADRDLAERGYDARSAAQAAAGRLLATLADAVWRSWTGRARRRIAFDGIGPLASAEPLRCRLPEGFAHYAVYPEAYGAATAGRFAVLGIRSIGTTLAAMVAAAGGSAPASTVRPVGHPFDRRVALDPAMVAGLVRSPDPIAIVDEGPGLSGSSFGAVADLLESQGVAADRLHFFPSHGGDPGPEALPRHRARWRTAHRHLVAFDTLLLGAAPPERRLDRWFADLVGPPVAPIEDIAAGGWRRHRADAWPPIHPWWERRKYLLRTADGPILLKFVGLGAFGEKAFDRARRLHDAGFGNRPIAYRHGFLAEPWHADARAPRLEGPERRQLVERVMDYLTFRARRFPAAPGEGADVAALSAMARTNIAESLGPEMSDLFGRIGPPAAPRPIETDGRLHLWEWLRLPDGRILKVDGLDHHAAHDLIGCQDVAWDVAGAAVELDLRPDEVRRLAHTLGVPPPDLVFYAACYLAFQIGAASMAAGVEGEAERWRARSDRLRDKLGRLLDAPASLFAGS